MASKRMTEGRSNPSAESGGRRDEGRKRVSSPLHSLNEQPVERYRQFESHKKGWMNLLRLTGVEIRAVSKRRVGVGSNERSKMDLLAGGPVRSRFRTVLMSDLRADGEVGFWSDL